jgi:hypothetical protein
VVACYYCSAYCFAQRRPRPHSGGFPRNFYFYFGIPRAWCRCSKREHILSHLAWLGRFQVAHWSLFLLVSAVVGGLVVGLQPGPALPWPTPYDCAANYLQPTARWREVKTYCACRPSKNPALIVVVSVMLSRQARRVDSHRLGDVLTDAMESIVTSSGFRGPLQRAPRRKAARRRHPYGHGKVEAFSAGIEGTLICMAGLLIVYSGVVHLSGHTRCTPGCWGGHHRRLRCSELPPGAVCRSSGKACAFLP